MVKTLGEHLRNGLNIVSDERKIDYKDSSGVAFGKVVRTILSYEKELKHTGSAQRKKELNNLIKEARSGLEGFLGSSYSVDHALAFYAASRDETIKERFEQGFSDVLGTAWRSDRI